MTPEQQRLAAGRRSAQLRTARSKQRAALRGAPLNVLVPALTKGLTPELGTYTLTQLFTSKASVILGVGRVGLYYVLASLSREGLRQWHSDLRMGNLTLRERRRLVKEILRAAGERQAA